MKPLREDRPEARRRLVEKGFPKLTHAQMWALYDLYKVQREKGRPVSLQEFAEALGRAKSGAYRYVQTFSEKGLLTHERYAASAYRLSQLGWKVMYELWPEEFSNWHRGDWSLPIIALQLALSHMELGDVFHLATGPIGKKPSEVRKYELVRIMVDEGVGGAET